jgi:succinyl-diaminopimelate desuccinylase
MAASAEAFDTVARAASSGLVQKDIIMYETTSDSVELARKLVRFLSLNPPGEEKACADYLAHLLRRAGLEVELHEFAAGRPSMVARLDGTDDLKPLAFTGHVDVVPLGQKPWSSPPFAAEIRDGKLIGRGSSDMKAGVAASWSPPSPRRNGNRQEGSPWSSRLERRLAAKGLFILRELVPWGGPSC